MNINISGGVSYVVDHGRVYETQEAFKSFSPKGITEKISEWTREGLESLDSFANKVIETEIEFIAKPITSFVKDSIVYVVHLLNTHSVEIITFGIIVTAFGVMLAPLIGDKSGTWLGRMLGVTAIGTIWRFLI